MRAAPAWDVSPTRGLTLAELQAIAAEAAIAPDAVAQAALVVARGEDRRPAVQRWLGLPVAVAHEVVIDGSVSDAAWDEMVARLQTTFDATGTERRAGGVREWRDGYVRVALEARPTGHRLRLTTRREDGSLLLASIGTGCVALGGLVAALVAAKTGVVSSATWAAPGLILTVGLALIGVDVASLRAWRRRRESQVAALARELGEVQRQHEPPALPQG